MKKFTSYLLVISALSAILSGCAANESPSLKTSINVEDEAYYEKFKDSNISINVYNWGEYIADGSEDGMPDINEEFEKLTGIKVNYSTYATNEELYAKMKGGGADYDIIIPSDYMISRMIKEDMLAPLDYSAIPNTKYILDTFRNPIYDENEQYSVPYTWGTVGIIYNKDLVEEDDFDWDILWNEKYAGQILMFDNPRDAFAISELILGYSLNTEDSEELTKAAEKLIEQKPLVQAYVMDEIFDKMGAGEAALAPYYAGDGVTLMQDYDHLGFVTPKSGTNRFVDALCIPKTSQKIEAAQMYINFLCEPEVSLENSMYIGYSTPNSKTFEMLDNSIKNNGISYLPDEFLEEKTTIFKNLSDEANQLMQDLWTTMKSTQ